MPTPSHVIRQVREVANRRVTWICFLLNIIQHLVTMIRPERNFIFPFLLFDHQRFHYPGHIHIAVEVIGFEEISLFIALRTSCNEQN